MLQLLSLVSKLVEGTLYVGKEGEKGVRKGEEKPTTKRRWKNLPAPPFRQAAAGCFAQFVRWRRIVLAGYVTR